jgi:hypothetical protein
MNWEMSSAIGKILGPLGVIISLVYLALEMRAQKKNCNTAVNSLNIQFNEFTIEHIENGEFCAILLRGLMSFDQLDGASKLRFGFYIERQLRVAETLYFAYLEGALDVRIWRGLNRSLGDIVAYHGLQSWWPTRKHWYSDEFCALVDGHIQTAKPRIYEAFSLTTGSRCSLSSRSL